MSSQTYSSNNVVVVAGRYNEKFTYQATATTKVGDVFKVGGKVVGIAVEAVEVDDEPRPVAVLVSGVVYPERINASADEKKELLANTGVKFFGVDTTETGNNTNGTQNAGGDNKPADQKPGQ